MPRFIFETALAIEAASLDEAAQIANELYDTDDWNPTFDERVTVFSPGGDPVEVVDDEDDAEAGCLCPPGLVERGGFASCCPIHGRPQYGTEGRA